MPASGRAAPQPLGVTAFGEIAISRNPVGGAEQIAWGSFSGNRRLLNTAKLVRTESGARLDGITAVFDSAKREDSRVGVTETYGFSNGGRTIYFWTMVPKGQTVDSEMYEIDIASGALRPMYETPSHNETHLFPGGAYGLEESNRMSDPDGAWRGLSSLNEEVVAMTAERMGAPLSEEEIANYAPNGPVSGFDRPFDLFVVPMDSPGTVRQLTDFSRFGAHATQSVPSPDGRRVVYSVFPRCSRKHSGAGGIYIGTFVSGDSGS